MSVHARTVITFAHNYSCCGGSLHVPTIDHNVSCVTAYLRCDTFNRVFHGVRQRKSHVVIGQAARVPSQPSQAVDDHGHDVDGSCDVAASTSDSDVMTVVVAFT